MNKRVVEDNKKQIKAVFDAIHIKDELKHSSEKYLSNYGFVLNIHHKNSRPTTYQITPSIDNYGNLFGLVLDTITKIDGVDLPGIKKTFYMKHSDELVIFANKVLAYEGTGSIEETSTVYDRLGIFFATKK